MGAGLYHHFGAKYITIGGSACVTSQTCLMFCHMALPSAMLSAWQDICHSSHTITGAIRGKYNLANITFCTDLINNIVCYGETIQISLISILLIAVKGFMINVPLVQ